MVATATILALLIAPTTAADPEPHRSEPGILLTYSTAEFTGDVHYATPSAVAVHVSQAAASTWHLDATSVNVHWKHDTWIEIGRPTNASNPLGTFQVDATSGNASFSQAHATARLATAAARTDIVAEPGEPMKLHAEADEATLTANPSDHRAAGAAADYPPLQVWYAVPTETVQAVTHGANLTLAGDFSIHLWSTNVTVRDDQGRQTFRTGTWTDPIGLGEPTPSNLRTRHYQTVRLDVVAGLLTLANAASQTEWLAADLTATGNGTITFEDAHRDERTPADRFDGHTTRNFTFQTWADRSETPRLSAIVTRQSAAPAGPSAPDTRRPTTDRPVSTAWLAPYGPAAAAATVTAGIALAARHLRPPTIDDLEWAILSGRIRRARRLGRRLVRRSPGDPDPLFLYGTALLALKDHRTIRRHVEPRADAIPADRRAGIAFILAASASAQGDPSRARRWAADASREPALRRRLLRRGLAAAPAGGDEAANAYA